MPEDYTITYGRIRDDQRFNQDGTITEYKVVQIFIGKHGPFTERFTAAEWNDQSQRDDRIRRLREVLRSLPS